MRTLDDIRLEIERATERRAELLHVLAEGHDVVVAAEHAEVEADIALVYGFKDGMTIRIEPYMSQAEALEAVGLSE